MTISSGSPEAIEKSRLTMLLGAGFSQALGIPGTRAISDKVDAKLEYMHGQIFIDLRDRLRSRFGESRYNFETLAAALEAVEPFGQLGFLPGSTYLAVEPEIAYLREGLTAEIARNMYTILMGIVMQEIYIDWKSIAPVNVQESVHKLFERLREQYVLDIVTLNYDLAIEDFVSDAVDGFLGDDEYQRFRSDVFLAVDNRPRLAHLHGSLRYGIAETNGAVVKNAGPLTSRKVPLWLPRLDGSYHTGMITGSAKSRKLVLPPYSVYFAWLAHCFLSSPRMVVFGYGVGDVHVNAWLMNAARHHAATDYRIVIIDRFDEGQAPKSVMEFFVYGAGFEHTVEAESFIKDIKFTKEIAKFQGAMLVRSGMPLSTEQIEIISEFLNPKVAV